MTDPGPIRTELERLLGILEPASEKQEELGWTGCEDDETLFEILALAAQSLKTQQAFAQKEVNDRRKIIGADSHNNDEPGPKKKQQSIPIAGPNSVSAGLINLMHIITRDNTDLEGLGWGQYKNDAEFLGLLTLAAQAVKHDKESLHREIRYIQNLIEVQRRNDEQGHNTPDPGGP